ncbi:hypothetical protein HS962_20250 [Pantoea sp. BIGb0393]|uniref:Uncharacterized protein n=1 Tax=Pantoea nemavictus TaxID=2726955 RepID=A0ABU8PY54_9GAMM|nr:hypothetical protein [Pantoea nemavictus]MBA0038540.1 hypothetical protein [Pantoea nemavictus]
MNYSNFEAKVSFWPHMHFTAIEMAQCGEFYEIYATDLSRLSKSKLFLGRTHDKHLADTYCKHFEEWLPKVNRAMKLRTVAPLALGKIAQTFTSQCDLETLPGQVDASRNSNHW